MLRVVLFALLALLAGCRREVGPPLVEVDEVAPEQIEALDRLEIRGKGFPQGHRAHVTFRGQAHRPGEPAESVVVEAEGTVDGPDVVQLAITETLVERFCGAGDRATHTTFTGIVEIGFASRVAGAPPLVGSRADVRLDLHPAARRADVLARRADEGTRLATFLGLALGPAVAHGLVVDAVLPGSPAQARGILQGDVLAAVDGVRVHELADVVPSSPRNVTLTVRRAPANVETDLSFSLARYGATTMSPELVWVAALVLLVLGAVVLLVTPGPRWLARAEHRLSGQLRGASVAELLGSVVGTGRTRAFALVASVAVGFALVSARADEVACVLVLAAAALLVLSREGHRPRGRGGALVLAMQVAPAVLVLPLALFGVVILEGAVHVPEIVAAQAGPPWHAEVARRPLAMLLAGAFVVALVTVARTRPRIAGRADVLVEGAAEAARSERRALAERLALFAACALGAVVFLGGPSVSGAFGALTLTAKAWVGVAVVTVVGRIATPWSGRTTLAFTLTRLLPGLAAVLGAVVLERRVASLLGADDVLGALLTGFAVAVVVRAVVRVRSAVVHPPVHASPFL